MTGKTTASRNNMKKRRSTSVAGLLNVSKVNAAKGASGSLVAKHTNNSKAIGERRELVAKRAAAATQRLLARRERNASGKRNLNKNAENKRLDEEDIAINKGLNEMLRGFEDQFNAIDVQVKVLKLNEEVDALKKEIGPNDLKDINAETIPKLNKIREIFNKYVAYFRKDKALVEKLKAAIKTVFEKESLDGIQDPNLKDIVAFMIPLMGNILPILGPAFKGGGYTDDLPDKFNDLARKLSESRSMRGGDTAQEQEDKSTIVITAVTSFGIIIAAGVIAFVLSNPIALSLIVLPFILVTVIKIRMVKKEQKQPESVATVNPVRAVSASPYVAPISPQRNGLATSLTNMLATIFAY